MSERRIRIERRMVDGRHIFTSPEVPEFYVSHENLAIAVSEIEPVLAMVMRLKGVSQTLAIPTEMALEGG